ncbi:MAG: cysteine--tRNA ligase [Actinomycetales bacterium]|nr:cysteine--tRNA ligase [Actinomycetales bacterium]
MLRLYDTRARAVVPITAGQPGHLKVYACGPTVYRDAHLGNLRTFLLPDLIRRIASHSRLQVTVVQNITDVGHMLDDTGLGGDGAGSDAGQLGEDRMLQAAGEGGDALRIARHYEAQFRADCDLLGINAPTASPRASESISAMVDVVQRLLQAGHAYVGADGSVFFDARSFPGYGAISGNRLEDLRPGHRFDGATDPSKRFHADWALWKAAPATRTQLVWDTPFGRGFPGWHIECTAMLLDHLGEQVDIHTGGIDLRFPHHEDERAQTESVVGHEVVRHWVHAEHLLFEGRKMSKSAGNVVLMSDVVARGLSPRAVRLAFLEQHYRSQVDLSWDSIAAADRLLKRWRALASKADATMQSTTAAYAADIVSAIADAFCDDLDTAAAIRLLRTVERSDASDALKGAVLLACEPLLGLGLDRAEAAADVQVPADVASLLAQRAVARAAKQWSESDRLREEILGSGWVVTDTADGQQVSPSQP